MVGSIQSSSILVLICGLLTACSPYIYKNDVKKFSDGVDQAAGAFNGLHDRLRTKYKNDQLNELAEKGTPLGISDDCTHVVTSGRLVADTRCLSKWSVWRNEDPAQRGDPPDCQGDVSPAVREGRLEFYDLAVVGMEERQRCEIGIRTGTDQIHSRPLKEAEVLLVEAPRLLSVLRAYGDSLAAIADSEDRDALESSVAEAKQSLNGLAARVDKLTGDEDQTLTASVGILGDLVGTALVRGLDYRRYKSLQNVTFAADPAVQRATMLLSQVAMPMTTIELQDAGALYLEKVADTNGTKNQAWRDAYAKAREAQGTYLGIFNIGPSAVLKSMGNAHRELTEALQDPKRQRDALQKSLQEFVSKANAAYETFTQ